MAWTKRQYHLPPTNIMNKNGQVKKKETMKHKYHKTPQTPHTHTRMHACIHAHWAPSSHNSFTIDNTWRKDLSKNAVEVVVRCPSPHLKLTTERLFVSFWGLWLGPVNKFTSNRSPEGSDLWVQLRKHSQRSDPTAVCPVKNLRLAHRSRRIIFQFSRSSHKRKWNCAYLRIFLWGLERWLRG